MDKQICDCYHTKIEKRYIYHPITGEAMPYGKEIGICHGTRECDQCYCGGDRKKCDFYEEVRNGRAKANK